MTQMRERKKKQRLLSKLQSMKKFFPRKLRFKKKGTWWRLILLILGSILLCAGLYVLYVVLSYDRINDKETLEVEAPAVAVSPASPDGKYSVVTYNIGFGAYTPDFSFFMDGGTESVAANKESVLRTTAGAVETVKGCQADFVMLQEVDLNSTRSHHVNQQEMFSDVLTDYYSNFAINYDSAFLLAPPWKPIGKSLSGMAVYSKYPISSAIRRSFPIASGFNKFLDLDRCYSVSRIPLENGKALCLYTVHLSAYGHDASVRKGQIDMLMKDMDAEYQADNYVVCGGDFNHDMENSTTASDEVASWAHPFPREDLPDGFSIAMDSLIATKKTDLPKSVRGTDKPYDPETSYTVTLDGFIISDNVKCLKFRVLDEEFRYSDHNPVQMVFSLN